MAFRQGQWDVSAVCVLFFCPLSLELPSDLSRSTLLAVKVHYTFDRDSQVHCLARWPHILQIQSIPLDDRTTIGVVDLRTCLLAVAQCSPEIVNQHDNDYSVYATDYSEENFPLVGQGMLSWGLDPNNEQQTQQKLVTGRVARNLMALLGNGHRETLEVRLKLTAVTKMLQQPQCSDFSNLESLNVGKFAPTPTDSASEWNSFIQSDPLGHSGNVASIPSPALPPAHLSQSNGQTPMLDARFLDVRSESLPPPPVRPASIPPASLPATNIAPAASVSVANGQSPILAPQPVDGLTDRAQALIPPRPSRPSSRASRNRVPTGRPRGRPRKKPLDNGNTSAAEDGTDGDEGPQKKRAKITQTEYSTIAPFGSAPDSLRVAASISGSIRNMRPVGLGSDAPMANHLQDVPRAPTPVPDGSFMHKQQQRMRVADKRMKPELVSEADMPPMYQRRPSQPSTQRSMSQDAMSPADSIAQSPDQGYTPEDSPPDLGSSPPVVRTSAYIGSSPPASSPILPAMPMPQVDSGFMSGGIDDFFDEEDILQELPQAKRQDLPEQPREQIPAEPTPPPVEKPKGQKASRPRQRQETFPFHEVNPGPPELLPTTSIFNPAGKARTLNRPPGAPPLKKPVNRPFKRSNTAPNPVPSEPVFPTEQYQQQVPEQSATAPHHPQRSQSQDAQPQPSGSQEDSFESNIENVLHRALKQEVGDVNRDAQQPIEAPMAVVMPVPERPVTTEPVLTLPTQPASKPSSRPASRPASRGPSTHPIAASDPPTAPSQTITMPEYRPPPPPSEPDPPRYSKNEVKKQSIKERLLTAIQKGESPPFCNNCGAIETPTWRKIWTQDHHGIPGFHEFSDKPGNVTTIDILERDAEGKPSMYRLVKKHLGPTEDKKSWNESLLCNRKFLHPGEIWGSKTKRNLFSLWDLARKVQGPPAS